MRLDRENVWQLADLMETSGRLFLCPFPRPCKGNRHHFRDGGNQHSEDALRKYVSAIEMGTCGSDTSPKSG